MASLHKYVGKGVRTDCRNLIEMYSRHRTVRFREFAEVWREMKFPYIYFGRRTFDELVEFTEEALRIAKEFWLDSISLNEKAGGLYLLHGLFIKQPAENFVKIRITLSDLEKILDFHRLILRGEHHDANYIYAKLWVSGAFHFCATKFVHGLEKNTRRYLEQDRSLMEDTELNYNKQCDNLEMFAELKRSLEEYDEAKSKLGAQDISLLSYVKKDFADILSRKLMKVIPLPLGDETLEPGPTQRGAPRDPRYSIFQRAIKNRCPDDSDSDNSNEENNRENFPHGKDFDASVMEQMETDGVNVGSSVEGSQGQPVFKLDMPLL